MWIKVTLEDDGRMERFRQKMAEIDKQFGETPIDLFPPKDYWVNLATAVKISLREDETEAVVTLPDGSDEEFKEAADVKKIKDYVLKNAL